MCMYMYMFEINEGEVIITGHSVSSSTPLCAASVLLCQVREREKKTAIKALTRPLFLCADGARIASSTGVDILLLDDFKLVINDTTHLVRPPRRGES